MTNDDQDFGENPFRDLDSARFRADRTKPAGFSPYAAGILTGELEADKDMFMRAMKKLPSKPSRKAKTGFLLAEHFPDNRLPEKSSPPQKPLIAQEQDMPKKRKPVPDEDNEAFLLAMRNTTPLGGKGRKVGIKPELREPPSGNDPTLEDFMSGKLEFALSFTDEYLEGHVVGLDELLMNRLREGQLSPEAHLDLHGLNANQAYESLREFMRSAWFKGLRVVLLVPGRGKNSPDGLGILRHKLQSWLTQDPFKRVVLAFCTARPHDGGPGSIYVLLRKYRKKGRIYWERLPADADLY